MKYFLFILLFFSFYSCKDKSNEKKEISPIFKKIYQDNLKSMEKEPQFIIDKLELLYLKKGLHNNEAALLIKKIPERYKFIIATFNILFLDEVSQNIKLNNKFLSILLKFQENKNIQKFIAENFYNAVDSSGIKAFYLLYALNYDFTPKDYENYLEIKGLTNFIKLNFILNKVDYCKNNFCSKNYLDEEKYLNYLYDEIYSNNKINYKIVFKDYKKTLKYIKKLKKELRKIYKINRRLKRKKQLKAEDEENFDNKKDKINFYNNKIVSYIKIYLYFYGGERKLPKKIDKSMIAENFLINNTKINKKIFYFVYNYARNKRFSYRIIFYKYLKNSKIKLSKRDKNRLKFLRYSKRDYLLKYGFYKRYFPELFKKLDVKNYLGSNFVFVLVKDFEWYFLENFRKNPMSIKNLIYFIYEPELIINQKDKLFELYTRDKIGNYKISGNESLLYNLLKILLKNNAKLTAKQIKFLSEIKIIYFQEILKYFE